MSGREMLAFQIRAAAPFLIAIFVVLVLGRMLPAWAPQVTVACGLVGAVLIAGSIAFGFGNYGRTASPIIRALFKIGLLDVGMIVMFGALQAALGPFIPRSLSIAFGFLALCAFVILTLRPLLGYGRLGRELTAAVKEDERRGWRR
jgi:hypothetical protein